jgi:hypothetical protein
MPRSTGGLTPSASPLMRKMSRMRASSSARSRSTPSAKLSRITGKRRPQSQAPWASRPRNSASVPLKLGERIQEQRLAEAPRAGQEGMRTGLDEPQRKAGLIDVVAVVRADLAEGVDTDGQALAGHGGRSGSGGAAGRGGLVPV